MLRRLFLPMLSGILLLSGCQFRPAEKPSGGSCRYARWFELLDSAVVLISPYDGHRDTVSTREAAGRIVCFSTSYVACLSAIGAHEAAVGVSGVRFTSDTLVRKRAKEVGYEGAPDYETILGLSPDLVLSYRVSAAVPAYVTKMRDLGLPVLLLCEHLEAHPLARAEYVRLFGALTHRRAAADSLFAAIETRYLALADRVARARAAAPEGFTRRVLVNIPYNDLWYVPGGDNYLSQLARDAGGEIAGARAGSAESRVMGLEEAYALSQTADAWLHPGWCRTRAQLRDIHPLFAAFPVLGKAVYNNTLRTTPEGGNDFWESGVVWADRVLEDWVTMLHPEVAAAPLHYYLSVE